MSLTRTKLGVAMVALLVAPFGWQAGVSVAAGKGPSQDVEATEGEDLTRKSKEELVSRTRDQSAEYEDVKAADAELLSRNIRLKECPEGFEFMMQPKIQRLALEASNVRITGETVWYGGCPSVEDLKVTFAETEARVAAGEYQ